MVTPQGVVNAGLLADRHGHPAGVLLEPVALGQWLDHEWFTYATSKLPCYVLDATLAASGLTTEAVQSHGIQIVSASAVWYGPGERPATLPSTVQWIAGAWYLDIPSKPHAAQAASRQRALQLIQLVSEDADTAALEEVFRQDAALSYQLLRLVNSAAMASNREVTSFAQAILMLGRQQLKRWLHLLLYAAQQDELRSAMLMAHVVRRARGLELIAAQQGLDKALQEQAFMAGMFSMLNTLIGQPLSDILRPIRITDELRMALLEHKGPIGQLLSGWQVLEHGDARAIESAWTTLRIEAAQGLMIMTEATAWMFDLSNGRPAER